MIRLTDDLLSVPHGFFGRTGGVSSGIYDSLNCGFGTDDDREAIRENRRLVAEAAGVPGFVTVHQHHSALCHVVTQMWKPEDAPKADAMVTDVPGLSLGILTADCAPVLFYGEKADGAPVIGAAHAGWKGALGGVTGETVAAMLGLGARAETIRAVVGPCIGTKSYEVSAPFLGPFLNDLKFFRPGVQEGKFMFDLPAYVMARLERDGVRSVSFTGHDTCAGEAEFFSYRRSTLRKEPDYGRQVSVIGIPR